jgi:hypothetical protein
MVKKLKIIKEHQVHPMKFLAIIQKNKTNKSMKD